MRSGAPEVLKVAEYPVLSVGLTLWKAGSWLTAHRCTAQTPLCLHKPPKVVPGKRRGKPGIKQHQTWFQLLRHAVPLLDIDFGRCSPATGGTSRGP